MAEVTPSPSLARSCLVEDLGFLALTPDQRLGKHQRCFCKIDAVLLKIGSLLVGIPLESPHDFNFIRRAPQPCEVPHRLTHGFGRQLG